MADLKIKIFADGANTEGMLEMAQKEWISGFTTNPTLMKKAGIENYEAFAREIISAIPDKPISFEVFSDDLPEMKRQALKISEWGDNVYVKIPITNTRGESTAQLSRELAARGVKQNVTALMTLDQVRKTAEAMKDGPHSYISVFAGRIADTGIDPVPVMKEAMQILSDYPNIELIWASPREVLNICQADEIGCDIITVTNSLLAKLPNLGKDLDEFSLDTVKMFYNDAKTAGYRL